MSTCPAAQFGADIDEVQNKMEDKAAIKERKIVGILGGMGPAASSLLYEQVVKHTKTSKDQDHIDMIIYSKASIRDRTELIAERRENELLAELLQGCQVLVEAGADVIAMASNAAHVVAAELRPQLPTAFLNLVDRACVEAYGIARKNQRVAILATKGTIASGVYQETLSRFALTPYLPSPENQERLTTIIYDCVKAGKPVDPALWTPINAELRKSSSDVAILAATELSVAALELELDEFYLDATQVLVQAIIEFGGGEYLE